MAAMRAAAMKQSQQPHLVQIQGNVFLIKEYVKFALN